MNDALRVVEFNRFISEERTDRAMTRAALEQDREERARQQRSTSERQDAHHARLRAEALAKRVPSCDGSSPGTVREWLREIDLTTPYLDLTVYVATQSAQGALRRELEHYLEQQKSRDRVSWKDLRGHLQKAFLSPHEEERLRHDVEKMRQGAYENTAAYGRRFRESADLAYPVLEGVRNQDQQRLLLRAYMRGLRDRHVVERLIKEGRPDTYSQAMNLVTAYEADDYRLRLALDEGTTGSAEEPMEVGALQPAAAPDSSWAKDLAEVKRQVSGLTQHFTKLMATLQKGELPQKPSREQRDSRGRRPPAEGNTEFAYTPEGAPICHFCHKEGHIQRFCRLRQGRQQQRREDTQSPQGGQ
jgi:hypothetical protein